MNQLPGFFTPSSPNADDRIVASADGSVEMVLLDNEPATLSQEGYAARLLQVFGSTQSVVIDAAHLANCLMVLDAMPGLKRLVFNLRPTDFNLKPGSYELQLLHRGREVLRRSLNVPSRPPA